MYKLFGLIAHKPQQLKTKFNVINLFYSYPPWPIEKQSIKFDPKKNSHEADLLFRM